MITFISLSRWKSFRADPICPMKKVGYIFDKKEGRSKFSIKAFNFLTIRVSESVSKNNSFKIGMTYQYVTTLAHIWARELLQLTLGKKTFSHSQPDHGGQRNPQAEVSLTLE
jgi:hypothetical protein